MDAFIVWITSTISLILGVYIGSKISKSEIESVIGTIKKKIKPKNIGPIRKLTKEQRDKIGTPQEAEEQAMEETLDRIFQT